MHLLGQGNVGMQQIQTVKTTISLSWMFKCPPGKSIAIRGTHSYHLFYTRPLPDVLRHCALKHIFIAVYLPSEGLILKPNSATKLSPSYLWKFWCLECFKYFAIETADLLCNISKTVYTIGILHLWLRKTVKLPYLKNCQSSLISHLYCCLWSIASLEMEWSRIQSSSWKRLMTLQNFSRDPLLASWAGQCIWAAQSAFIIQGQHNKPGLWWLDNIWGGVLWTGESFPVILHLLLHFTIH